MEQILMERLRKVAESIIDNDTAIARSVKCQIAASVLDDDEQSFLEYLIRLHWYGEEMDKEEDNFQYWENITDAAHQRQVIMRIQEKLGIKAI